MLNRRLAVTMTALLAVVLLAGPAMAQQAKKYAVMPFTYNGPKKYSYFPKAFQASLNNDLEWAGYAEPAGDALVQGLKVPSGKAEAISILRSSELDYLISGTISILGKEATLNMAATTRDGKTWEKSGQMGIDEITPWLDEQSKAIMGDVFNRPGYSTTEEASKGSDIEDQIRSPLNSSIVQADNDEFHADTLNPQFRYEGGTENQGRWRSQTFRFFSTSMVVADADNDGKNEIFILQAKGLSAYRFNKGKLEFLDTMEMTPSTTYMRLEAVDVTKDGIPELVVASYQAYYRSTLKAPEGTPRSHILSFENGKFKYLLKNYKQFLGVLRMPPFFKPSLVIQRIGRRHIFAGKIYEAYYKNGELVEGETISTPEFGNIFNMLYLPDGLGYKYLVLDDFNRLKVYSQSMERLSSSDDATYNSSGVGLEVSDKQQGMGPGTVDEKVSVYNVPIRMIAARLSSKDKYELLVNKDLSIASQVFERFKYFSQGEIHSLAWDGVGMNLAWKTRRIRGQVSDIALADLNNDGKKQLCVLVNTFPGSMGFTKRKTVVLAYDLNAQ